jgi:hypothetical protein
MIQLNHTSGGRNSSAVELDSILADSGVFVSFRTECWIQTEGSL